MHSMIHLRDEHKCRSSWNYMSLYFFTDNAIVHNMVSNGIWRGAKTLDSLEFNNINFVWVTSNHLLRPFNFLFFSLFVWLVLDYDSRRCNVWNIISFHYVGIEKLEITKVKYPQYCTQCIFASNNFQNCATQCKIFGVCSSWLW